MDLPPFLFQNFKGSVLAHFLIYQISDKKLRKNSNFAMYENEPEMTLRPNIKDFLNFKAQLGPNNNMTPNEYINKENNCLEAAVFISGCTSTF